MPGAKDFPAASAEARAVRHASPRAPRGMGRAGPASAAADGGDVLADLRDEGVLRGETPLVAQPAHELDLHALAVEVLVEPGDVDLEHGRLARLGVERRPHADVGDRRPAAA